MMLDVLNWFASDFDRFLGLLIVIMATGYAIGLARGNE